MTSLTHIENLNEILRSGELRSYNLMRGQSYRHLANEDVQAGRSVISIGPSQKPLHDYVPLYLGFKTPMVAINQSHNEFVGDGNARSAATKFYSFSGPDIFSKIDVAAIRSVKYAKDPELKRKKQAEILIPDKLQINQMLDIICYSEGAKTRTLSILSNFGISKPVKVNQGWFFTAIPKEG